MPDEIVIRFSVKDDGSPVIERVNSKLKETQKEATALAPGIEKARSSMTDFASANAGLIAVVTGSALALRKLYDVAKQGAELEYTRTKFDRLAESIGTTSDALLYQLSNATKGTLSDMQAMALASDLLSLGLAKNADEAVRLATVQSGLGMDMNQLVLTLTNQTTMRFDQLGVSVDGFDEKVKKLKESGMDANTAFKEAFLQQAEEQLNKVGNAADEDVGAFKALEASVSDFFDTAKTGTAQVLAPLARSLSDLINNELKVGQAIKELGLDDFRDFKKLADDAGISVYELADKVLAAAYNVETFGENTRVTAEQIAAMSKANEEFLNLVGKLSDQTESFAEKYKAINEDMNLTDEERAAKLAELAAQEEEANRRVILSMLEKQLALDGLSAVETEYLLKKGEEWGIYSAEAVEAARAAMEEVQALSDAIASLPTSHTLTFTVEGAEALNIQRGGEKDYVPTPRRQNATGGTYMIPTSWGNERFPIGTSDTASGGELISITPKGKDPNAEVVAAIYATRLNIDELTRAFVLAAQQVSK